MKDLCSLRKGITHSGRFHTDDVISTAFIRYFNPDIEIERVKEYEGDPAEDEIVFDIGLGEFDHHQDVRRKDDNGHFYSAFGLLWEAYGREYLRKQGFTNIVDAFYLFRKMFVFKIDIGDNEGYRGMYFPENEMIINCNPLWFEEQEEIEREQFDKACKVGALILDNWTRNVYKKVETISYEF